jgi:protein-L-isoaspartate(D-aspartate) O-methyltransferase
MTLDFTAARVNMVDNQVRTNDVTDLPIQDAMRVVARERFCPPGKQYLAYAEADVEYAPGWRLMQPRDISKLLQAIYPLPGERALTIAAPYAAAVLAHMGLQVTLRQPEGPAFELAKAALEGTSVELTSGDIRSAGEGGPYQVLVCEGAVTETPKPWLDAIDRGGRLGVVERDGPVGRGRLYIRGEDGVLGRRDVFDSGTALMPGFEPQRAFSF